ncbi:hypothetical protein BHE74_00032253 [Ensete ventricosum]|nr:hypothetical protein BHE74_00032253 [Ensete ventricosum]
MKIAIRKARSLTGATESHKRLVANEVEEDREGGGLAEEGKEDDGMNDNDVVNVKVGGVAADPEVGVAEVGAGGGWRACRQAPAMAAACRARTRPSLLAGET